MRLLLLERIDPFDGREEADASAVILDGLHTDGEPRSNVETILLARPDVVLTMHREARGVPTIFLAWREPEDVKACMTLLGEVFAKPHIAAR